jgi:hypothetical protein
MQTPEFRRACSDPLSVFLNASLDEGSFRLATKTPLQVFGELMETVPASFVENLQAFDVAHFRSFYKPAFRSSFGVVQTVRRFERLGSLGLSNSPPRT